MTLQDWPANEVVHRPLAELIPYARNARTHSDAQIGQIAASIREWGWTMPILVDEAGMIIAGHGRMLAAERLGIDRVPIMVARGWSEAQKRAYVIADNKLTLNAGWNEDLLRVEVADLESMGFALPLMGFSAAELAALSGKQGLSDPDEVPEPPAVSITKRGDAWQLGRHRLVCGDATRAEDVARALAGVAPGLMVTDPPYGLEYDANWRNERTRANGRMIGGQAIGQVANDDRADWAAAWTLFHGDVVYVWHGALRAAVVAGTLAASGFDIRAQIIWKKDRMIIGRGDYHWHHEPCWYAVRKGSVGHWTGGRKQTTIWEIPHRASETGHSAQKPVECMKRPIENNSSPGQEVYDPFIGSGTTIIAAEMTGRACHALEIEPSYVDVAIERWQNFTGEKAMLDGCSFEEISAERLENA